MFCTNCGNKLSDDARFCTNCGQAVNLVEPGTSPVNTQPQYQQNQFQQPLNQPETARMVLQTQRKYSMIKMTACYIVFMQDRLVLAHLSKELQKRESDRMSQEIKASGKGFFKGSAAMMSFWADYYKKYYNMSSQQILAEDPENIVIHYSSISQLLFHAYYTDMSSDGSQQSTGGKLNISLAGGETIKFTHTIGSDRSVRDTLTELLGARLKYKR